jgi:hypothetical protein
MSKHNITTTAGTRERFPIFASMSSAAGALGVPVSDLRVAKRLGAPGFPASGRVETGPLLAWALGKGRKTKPGRSLEEARARLADVQATRIEKQEELSRGTLIPVLWAADVVGQQLDLPRAWVRGRLPRLAFLVSTVAGIPEPKRREDEVLRILTGDAEEILIMWRHIETGISQAFKNGPPDGPERTALGDLDAMCSRFMEALSAPCRDEIRGFVKTLQAERQRQREAKDEKVRQAPATDPTKV